MAESRSGGWTLRELMLSPSVKADVIIVVCCRVFPDGDVSILYCNACVCLRVKMSFQSLQPHERGLDAWLSLLFCADEFIRAQVPAFVL